MATIIKEKLDEQMKKEGINKGILENVTRRGFYDDLVTGAATDSDIINTAVILKCTKNFLTTPNNQRYALIGRIIAERMRTLGWSASTISDYTGIPSGSIFNACAGNFKTLSADIALSLAYAFDCDVRLLTGEISKSEDDLIPNQNKKKMLTDRYAAKRKVATIDPDEIKHAIATAAVTPSTMASLLYIPYILLRLAMSCSSTKLPECAINHIRKINTGEAVVKKTKNGDYRILCIAAMQAGRKNISKHHEQLRANKSKKVDKSSSSLTKVYMDQKEQEKHDKEARQELANKIPEMVKQRKDITMQMSMPSNGYISTGQLLSLAIITEKHSDLLNLLAEITELNQEDYDNLIGQIKWMVEVLKRNK